MAVEAKITGNGHYAGITTDLVNYSATEDATPLDPGDASGGVGQITFSVIDAPSGGTGSLMLLDDTVTLTDGTNGTTVGTVTGVAGNNGVVSVTADSRLGALLASRTAEPRAATIPDIFNYYLSLGGITSGIVVDTSSGSFIRNTDTVYSWPGWTGVIWDSVRAFAQSIGGELSLVSNNIVLRPVRGRIAVNKRDSSVNWSAQKGSLARTVEVNYYNHTYQANYPAYPIGGWDTDVQVYQVDAGETLTVNLPVDGTVRSVTQPVCLPYVGPKVTDSVYSVVGADGLAIVPAQWTQNGGSVTVAIGADQQSLDVTIVGAVTTQGPFRIAAGAGASDVYSSLRLTATGTFTDMKTLTLLTGVDSSQTAQIIGTTVDNRFISTLEQAYSLGLRTAGNYAGNDQSISVETAGINRADSSGSLAYPTFNDFTTGIGGKTTVYTGKTFNDFANVWPTGSFNDFSTLYYTLVQSNFSNQAFGNIAGARVQYRDAFYRITSGSVSPTGVSYDATRDTTFADFNDVWKIARWENQGNTRYPAKTNGNYTFDEFNAIMGSRSFNDLAVTPLWRTYMGYASRTAAGYEAAPVTPVLLPSTTLLPATTLIPIG